ncbi:MAG TPA: AMP-binding protein, partial [Gemmatimonadales bacterium]|nr:AMP-binding protein [Gemmatimonadales bacterium]
MTRPIWSPSPDRIARAQMTRFLAHVRARRPSGADEITDFPSLYAWSVERPDAFWPEVWRYCGVVADERPGRDPWDRVVVGLERMAPPDPDLGPRWFPGARLNFAENLLRYGDDREALVFWNEQGSGKRLTYAALRHEVAAAAAGLRAAGVGTGDRVAGFLPNLPETVVAMLAAASLGAVWSSCSPDFGANGVLDRFGQIRPKVLICADGYRYAGKAIDSLARVREVQARLPGIERLVIVPYLHARPDLSGLPRAERWDDFLAPHRRETVPAFVRLPFDHPLYIMYSSGTTGLPKCMVHGAGGTLLQHLKELVLHTDLGREDRLFYFTTCGWMMWNWLVSGLAAGATVVLYDGAPLTPPAVLWDMAADEGVSIFGTSAKYLALAEKAGLEPMRTHDLRSLRAILSTGSPLAGHS